MGCFFSCFQFKGDRKRKDKNRLKSSPVPPKHKESLLANDQFVSVFISEGSPCESPKYEDGDDKNVLERELRNEVKFLKSCGALLESPAEFQNSSTLDKDSRPSHVSSDLSGTFFGQFLKDEQCEDSDFQHNSSAGCCFEGHLEQEIHESSVCMEDANHDSVPGSGLDSDSAVNLSPFQENTGGANRDSVLGSRLDSAAVDVSPFQGDTEDVNYDSILESGLDSESAVIFSPFQGDTEDVNHDSVLDSGLDSDSAVMFSPFQGDTEDVNHDSVLESGLDSDSAVNFSPFQGDTEDVNHASVLKSGLGSDSAVNFSRLQADTEGVNHYSVLESRHDSAAVDVSSFQGGTEDVNHDSILESGLDSAAVDVSPFQRGTEDVNHDSVFDLGLDSAAVDVSPFQGDTQMKAPRPTNSPYPTPLKLTDEMETPGTIYPSNQRTLRTKHVRAQFVYPVLNPVENLSKWAVPREVCEPGKIQKISVAERFPDMEIFEKENYGSVKRQRSTTPLSAYKGGMAMFGSEDSWLKSQPANNENNGNDFGDAVGIKDQHVEQTPDGTWSLLGIACMEDEHLHISPKWWGGNGIPNTTTKYKEDQKVSWHATPFEERLDKALSDNKLCPERNINSRKLVAFEDEGAESD